MNKTPKQKEAISILGGPEKNVLLVGGVRSGKTAIIIYSLIIRALKYSSRHLILRSAFNHVKTSIWYDTFPKIAELMEVPYRENKSDWFYKFNNKSEIWVGGLDDKDRSEKILGSEYSSVFFNEVSQLTYDSINIARTRLAQKTGLVNKAYYDCNPPTKSHWVYKLFFQGLDPITKEQINKTDYVAMFMNPADNLVNLPQDFIQTLESLPYRQRQRFLNGIFLDDIEGALWNDSMIDKFRDYELPKEWVRKIIAIDPAVSYGEDSDETGIIVAGKCVNGHYWVMEDLSGKFSPAYWGNLVLSKYQKEMLSDVVAEVNQGGELVVQNIRQLNPAVSVRRVHASQGKLTRAEPIAALYEQGLVHHVGKFPELEEQMVSYTGKGMKSPDRMDALVWALTDLSEQKVIHYWA